ncbi:hypothetical protein L9F63_021969, partial [Diploptera punctata]
ALYAMSEQEAHTSGKQLFRRRRIGATASKSCQLDETLMNRKNQCSKWYFSFSSYSLRPQITETYDVLGSQFSIPGGDNTNPKPYSIGVSNRGNL